MDYSGGLELVPQAALQLAPQVVIGGVDVAAVGARALLSLQPPEGWTVRDVAVDIRGLQLPQQPQQQPQAESSSDQQQQQGHAAAAAAAGTNSGLRPVLQAEAAAEGGAGSSGSQLPALFVRNMYGPGTEGAAAATPQLSLLVLNAALPEADQGPVAAALMQLAGAVGGAAGGPPVMLVAGLLLQHLSKPAALYHHLLNGASLPPPLASIPPLSAPPSSAASPASSRVVLRDGQLAALLHVAAVAGGAVTCLLAPAHKPPAATPLDLPDSAAACDALGSALAATLGLQYDSGKCRTLRASYKWFVPEKAAGSDVMYL